MLLSVKDSSAGSSACCKPYTIWPTSAPEASSETIGLSAKPKELKLIDIGKHPTSELPKLIVTPTHRAASSREYKGLLADLCIRRDELLEPSSPLAEMWNRQETFFQRVVEHNERLRSQLSEMHSSSQTSIEEKYAFLMRRQEEILAELRKFSSQKPIIQHISQEKLQENTTEIPHITSNQEFELGSAGGPEENVFRKSYTKISDKAEVMPIFTDKMDSGNPVAQIPSFADLYDAWKHRERLRRMQHEESDKVRPSRFTIHTILDYGSGPLKKKRETKLFGELGMDKACLDQEEYKVEQFYHRTGIAQMVARSDSFFIITLLVIFLNAIYIGYEADNRLEDSSLDADVQFRIFENAFCVFFFLEWFVRLLAFRRKVDSLKDMWFKFDTLLMIMMVVETWIMPVFLSGGTGIPSGLVKLVRLLRLARMARMMRAFPDLVAMIKGVKAASRAVGSALLMLVGLIYVFAIILFTLLKGDKSSEVDMRFRRLGLAMWTLLIDGTFLDSLGELSRSLMDSNHYLSLLVLLVFVLCSALIMMNMLVGVLCEVVSAVAIAEREDCAIRLVKDKLLCLLKELDEDGDGNISREEMTELLKHDSAVQVLEDLHVDFPHFLSHLDMCYESEKQLTIIKIIDLILMLREDRPPTIKDMLLETELVQWKTARSIEKGKHCIVDSSH